MHTSIAKGSTHHKTQVNNVAPHRLSEKSSGQWPMGGSQRLQHSYSAGKPHLACDCEQLHGIDAEAAQALKKKPATCQVHAVEFCEAGRGETKITL